MDACTIVARRELARARVLAMSFRAHHPQSAFTVLVVDGVRGADTVDGASVLALEELVDAGELGVLAAGNPLDALPAALVPRLLEHLHGQGARPIVYLGAGLRVLGPLAELAQLAGEHDVVVVSRAVVADNGTLAFGEREGGGAISHRVLASGGGSHAIGLLQTWPRYFADERKAVHDWFDGIPAICEDVAVLRDPGYGLDAWTLPSHTRDGGAGHGEGVARQSGDGEESAEQGGDGEETARQNGDGDLRVQGRPARIVDLTTLDPQAPERPSNGHNPSRSGSVPALAELRRRHAQELLDAGHAQDATRHWRFASLRDGTPMTEVLRKLFLEGVQEGRLSESPFTQTGQEAFYTYLNEPAEHGAGAGLSRLHYAIWELRPDVQGAYPHLDGPDGPLFAQWLAVHAHEDHHVPLELLPAQAESPQDVHVRDIDVVEPLWGVNVAGFFTSELGLGEAARLLIAGLDARGVPALPVQAQLLPPCGQGAQFTYSSPQDAPYPISIVCINGDLIPPFAREVGEGFFKDRYTIALWWWEVGQFPQDWAGAFEHIDEVWVGSQHIYDAVAPASPVPVVKMTMPVSTPHVAHRTRAQLGMPEDGFLFLFVHDYHSTTARKNPVGVVEAFKRAFPPGSGAKLVVKSINATNVPHHHDRVAVAAREHPDITLIDAYVSAGEKNAMISACDCYVSLHRSEGFGLTAAEAMLLGKPVIATRYGGNLEFMNEENSYLVDWEPMAVGEDAHPYPSGGVWADPDLDHAAALMRKVFDNPEQARERAQRGQRETLARHAPHAAGEGMEARLRLTYERLTHDGVRSLNLAHRPAPVHPELDDLIARRPLAQGPGRRAAIKRLRQRVMARLTRRFIARQRAIDSRLRDEIERLEDRLYRVSQELNHRSEARFAQTLGVARELTRGLRDAQLELVALEHLNIEHRLDRLQSLGHELEHHLAQHRATPYVSEERAFAAWPEPRVGPVIGYRSSSQASSERRYIDFEAAFRGPESRVLEIQRAYLPLLAGQAPVLDVGCGRGELLDLLTQAGVKASGVDMDVGMSAHARDKGHEVALGDGVEHLRALPEGSLGGVVAIEVIEHLPYERLMEFLELARTRLRPDGVLLFETVNPHAVDAMKAFWVDPTHQHPIFPEVALELCRLAGFHEAFWFHPMGEGEFDRDRETQPIYAVLARTSP